VVKAYWLVKDVETIRPYAQNVHISFANHAVTPAINARNAKKLFASIAPRTMIMLESTVNAVNSAAQNAPTAAF
jgi:hypothetical protein